MTGVRDDQGQTYIWNTVCSWRVSVAKPAIWGPMRRWSRWAVVVSSVMSDSWTSLEAWYASWSRQHACSGFWRSPRLGGSGLLPSCWPGRVILGMSWDQDFANENRRSWYDPDRLQWFGINLWADLQRCVFELSVSSLKCAWLLEIRVSTIE